MRMQSYVEKLNSKLPLLALACFFNEAVHDLTHGL